MSEWQPIETAPRDGMDILALLKCGDCRVILWGKTYFGDHEWCFAHGGLCDEYGTGTRVPTHWMPLPEPPQ